MSPNDKIVSFKPALTVASEVREEATVPLTETEAAIGDMALTEMEAAVVDMAMFLLDNKDKVQNFVCGVAVNAGKVEDDEIDTEFHVITSPLEARDFALALRLLEDSFRRTLGGVIEE